MTLSLWECLSKSPGINGEIKFSPESFIVEEITPEGEILEKDRFYEKQGEEGSHCHFILQKRDWSTADAIRTIAKKLRAGPKRFSYAGNKDKTAITTQMASAFKVPPSDILAVKIKDISINGAWEAKDKVPMGALLGNRFTIGWKGGEDPKEKVHAVHEELDGKFPNYFGPQRFGSTRRNTHIVGELLLRRRFRDAAFAFLAEPGGELHEGARTARAELKETGNFQQALNAFPKHLRLERTMLYWLSKSPSDYIGAFRKLPRPVLLLFIHAFQSYLFNEMLSARVKEGPISPEEGETRCGSSPIGFPNPSTEGDEWILGRIIGYETTPNPREKALLEKHEIETSDFKLREIPELSSKGTARTLLAPYINFSFSENTFRFSLPAGSYATSLIREFLKVD